MKLIYFKKIDKILQEMLDKNYILQSSNAQNRIVNKYDIKKNKKNYKIGSSWHTDSRYLGGNKISKGFSFLIIALDPFTKENGATKFIEGSANFRKIPPRFISNRTKKYKIKELLMDEVQFVLWIRVYGTKLVILINQGGLYLYLHWLVVKPYYDYSPI